MSVNWALPFDETILPQEKSKLVDVKTYQAHHRESLKNPKEFWANVAKELDWFKPWNMVLDDSNPPFYKWFLGES